MPSSSHPSSTQQTPPPSSSSSSSSPRTASPAPNTDPTMDAFFRNMGNNLAGAGAAIHSNLDQFGQNTGRALDAWGQEAGQNLDPNHPVRRAMLLAGQASFAAANETSRAFDNFGQGTQKSVTDAYNHAHACVSQVDWEQLVHDIQTEIQKRVQELGLEVCKAAKQAVWRIQEAELPREIGDWIASHPGQTAFMFAAGAVFFAPSLITVPVLESLGFTVGGVTAGSAAAFVQAMIGNVATGSVFALLQSAAAGGAGEAALNGMTMATAGIAIGAAAAS